jgi:hypothetical protein
VHVTSSVSAQGRRLATIAVTAAAIVAGGTAPLLMNWLCRMFGCGSPQFPIN